MAEVKQESWKDQLDFRVRLRIYKNDLVFGPGVAELMEHVRETGSLSAACRRMEMAYSKGWKILKRAEEELGVELVQGTSGGVHGGKMELTDAGRELLRCYRGMDTALHQAAGGLFDSWFRPPQQQTPPAIPNLVVVRGGGDIATGSIYALWKAGFPVLVLEIPTPSAIRRQVALCEAVYEGTIAIEDMRGILIQDAGQAAEVIREGMVPILVDPEGASIERLHPAVVVDAILAKKNLGTRREMAPLTIALGPGFTAGEDVDLVIETQRGHNLGRIIREGPAAPNTGIPGSIGGYTKERVIHAAHAGILRNVHQIGDIVSQGETIARIVRDGQETPVLATITGIIRGLIRDGYPVTEGFKIADIDPRKEELKNCFTISDKARCIGGSVLTAVCGGLLQDRRN